MNKMISAILVGSITLGGLSLAVAGDNEYRGKHQGKYCKQGGGDGHKMGLHKKGMEQRMQRMMQHLDLSDDQASKVRAVFEQHGTRLSTLRSQMKNNRKALRESMHADTQDMTVIENLAKNQGELKTQKILIKANIKSEINNILSNDQREQMKNMRAKGKRHNGKNCKHG